MHDCEVRTDAELVARLVAEQHPHLVWPAGPAGARPGRFHAVYRLGDRLCARLTRVAEWAQDLQQELRRLPELAPYPPLA